MEKKEAQEKKKRVARVSRSLTHKCLFMLQMKEIKGKPAVAYDIESHGFQL